MKTMNRRRNCARTSVNTEPSIQCQQKQQRIRCYGRVINKDELNDQPLEDFQSRCAQSKQGQGRGQGRRNSQAQLTQNEQSQGRGSQNGQGKGRKHGQGQGRGRQGV